MTPPRIRHVLFDFDGVLAHYDHELRIGHLARHCSAAHERVREVLFTSGLETEYDGGAISTGTASFSVARIFAACSTRGS